MTVSVTSQNVLPNRPVFRNIRQDRRTTNVEYFKMSVWKCVEEYREILLWIGAWGSVVVKALRY